MDRFILRFSGTEEPPSDDIDRIRAIPEIKIINNSRRMLLVEASGHTLKNFLGELPGWHLSPEQLIPLPDAPKRVPGSKP